MRYLFIDEAGTSAKEPVTVVVALIVDADKNLLPAEKLVGEVLRGVPKHHKENFVFHATDVFNGAKYQNGWSATDRLNLLNSMMSIPRKVKIPITLSLVWRDAPEVHVGPSISQAQAQHIFAFALCVCVADRNIRTHGRPEEVATIICEDIPELRTHLKTTISQVQKNPMYLPQEQLRRTLSDEQMGFINQSGDLRVERVRNTVYFAEKSEDPLVQVADALAFGFRRYFANQSDGELFVKNILGNDAVRLLQDFASPSGVGCWWPKET